MMAIVKISGFCVIIFAEILFSMGAILQGDSLIAVSETPIVVDNSLSWDTKVFIPPGNYPGKPNIQSQDNNVIDTQKQQTFDDAIKDMEKTLQEDSEPCSRVKVPPKNFMVEGRRISEAKCLQHIWEVKKIEENERRKKQCMAKYSDFTTVVGGRYAKAGEFPHMGALGWKSKEGDYKFLCGSFLISEKFVLTAAHCSTADDQSVAHPSPKIVRFGVENIIKDKHRSPVDIKILKFTNHPNYRAPPYKTYDIAVVELAKSVKFNKFIRPACLLNQKVDRATVSGWGVVDTALYSTNTSDMLKVAEVDIVPTKTCNKLLRMKRSSIWKKVQSDQICATRLNETADACGGDSGGPLQTVLSVNTKKPIYNAIGVVSFGFVCARPKFPSIYTRVSSFIDWIEEQVWGSHERQFMPFKASGTKVHKMQHFTEGDLFWLNRLFGRWAYYSHDFPEVKTSV